MTRRDVLAALFVAACPLACLTACSPRPRSSPNVPPRPHPRDREASRSGPAVSTFAGAPVALHSWFDLPADPRSTELSGIAWDEASRTLWAVQDNRGSIVALAPDADLRTWRFSRDRIRVAVPGRLDLEGIVVVPDGFIVCSEVGPRILDLTREGTLRGEVTLPPHLHDARLNKSLESLALSPSGRYLFTANEAALNCDGTTATTHEGTKIRIMRFETRAPGTAPRVESEHAYATDPAEHEGSDQGVAELAAISDDELLVLERGWAKGVGNTARIYEVTLDSAASCLAFPQLDKRSPVLEKRLVVDLAKLPLPGEDAHGEDAPDRLPPSKQPQATPLLDNYEGMTIGPRLPDGRKTLLLVSDDNGRSDQFARVVVLAVG